MRPIGNNHTPTIHAGIVHNSAIAMRPKTRIR